MAPTLRSAAARQKKRSAEDALLSEGRHREAAAQLELAIGNLDDVDLNEPLSLNDSVIDDEAMTLAAPDGAFLVDLLSESGALVAPSAPAAGAEDDDDEPTPEPPTLLDYVCERGNRAGKRHGNQQFHQFVVENLSLYEASQGRVAKKRIQQDMVRRFRATGSRFLRQDKDTSQWYRVSDANARIKVGQLLRHFKRKQEEGGQKQPSKSVPESPSISLDDAVLAAPNPPPRRRRRRPSPEPPAAAADDSKTEGGVTEPPDIDATASNAAESDRQHHRFHDDVSQFEEV